MRARLPCFSLASTLLLGLALTGTAAATPAAGLSAAFDTCTDRARGLSQQRACVTQEKTRQDKRLNDVQVQLLRRLAPAARSRLQVAQRGWLQWHAREGEFATSLLGAPPTVHLEGGVMEAQRLAARAETLEHYLDQLR